MHIPVQALPPQARPDNLLQLAQVLARSHVTCKFRSPNEDERATAGTRCLRGCVSQAAAGIRASPQNSSPSPAKLKLQTLPRESHQFSGNLSFSPSFLLGLPFRRIQTAFNYSLVAPVVHPFPERSGSMNRGVSEPPSPNGKTSQLVIPTAPPCCTFSHGRNP